MHKTFYASGFLRYPPGQQILLQQLTDQSSSRWSLISGLSKRGETPEEAFSRILFELLKLKISPKHIHSIYEREDEVPNIILYTEVSKAKEFPPSNGLSFAWFNRKQVLKLPLDPQVKQDIVVGQRVIDAKIRKSLGQQTLE